MSRRPNPPFPTAPFALILVEGGDERAVCEAVAGAGKWANLQCWCASGQTDLPTLGALAAADPNARYIRSVGVILDIEDDAIKASAIAGRTLAAFGATGTPSHGALSAGTRPLGAFLVPDGASNGSIETLCRRAVRNPTLAACVDALVSCAGSPHPNQARADKGWLKAYLSMLPDPNLRFHQSFSIPDGIDPAHAVFDPLRRFLLAL
jgi:hypothetical protein